jgi:tetratricopeptide (TPR) repeat protein
VHLQLALDQYKAGRMDSCKQQLARVLATSEPPVTAYLLAAKVALHERRYDEARGLLEVALNAGPEAPDAWYAKALLEEHDDNLEAAVEAMARAHLLDPNDPEYLICLAELHVKHGEADRALAVLEGAQGRFTSHEGLQSALADLYMLKGDYSKAVVSLRRILRLNSGDEEIRQRLALALAADGQAGQAAPLLEQVIAAQKGDATALRAALADCYLRLENYDKAEGLYAGLCAKQPGHVGWNYRLAEVYALQHDDDAALERARHLLTLDPSHGDARALVGYLQMARGDLENAEKSLRMALDGASEPTLVAVALKKTLLQLGREKEAAEVWAEYGNNVAMARSRGAAGSMATSRVGTFHLGRGL